MKYVEDIILELSGVNQSGLWVGKKPFEVSNFDLKYIDSFAISLIEGKHLTEPQQKLTMKILLRNKSNLEKIYNFDAEKFFSNPPWKNPPRIIDKSKKIYIENNTVVLKSPYDQKVIETIRTFDKKRYTFDGNKKQYIFNLDEKCIAFLSANFYDFEKDPKIAELNEQINAIKAQPEKYIPMICFENNQFVYKNTHTSIPSPTKTDLIDVLMETRKYGITVWDDHIEQMLKQDSVYAMSKRFFQGLGHDTFVVNQQEINNLESFKQLINASEKVLFAVNGNDQELPKIFSQLKNLNYKADQCCVLFRTSNPKFNSINEYIKENQLNNKVNNAIKFFFVDYTRPLTKVILENEIKFDLVFLYSNEMSYGLIPHTMRTFLLNCQNVVSTFDYSMSRNW